MIKITENAKVFLKKSIYDEEIKNIIIYLSVMYPFTQYAHVNMIYCKKSDINSNDIKIDNNDELLIYIENKSLSALKNAIIDVKDEQLMIKAPNIYLKNNKNIMEQIKFLFENEVNVMLSQHGGFVQLVDVFDDTLTIKFHGGCQGCGMVGYTLNNYIEKIIKKNFPQIKKIKDVTSHDVKDNSYY